MHANRQARLVHHHKHGGEAFILFANQIAGGAAFLAKLHHTRRARHDAELMFDTRTDDIITRAKRSVSVDQKLRHQKQRNSARASWRIGQAREHEMDDVLRHLMFAVGDKNLGARNCVAAITPPLSFSFDDGKIRAGVRLGQVHGAGPFARHHVWQIAGFERIAAANQNGVNRALGEQRAQTERQVRGIPNFAHRH